jgi:hypothetical protein
MKKLLILATIILCFVSISYGQKVTPKQTATTKTPENSVIEETSDAEDQKLVSDLQQAKNKVLACYVTYFKTSRENRTEADEKLEKTCSKSAREDLTEIYNKLSKRPNAIKIMIADELTQNLTYHYIASAAGVFKPRTEENLEAQVNLQRIITIQNQRIIELLEQLVKKKP